MTDSRVQTEHPDEPAYADGAFHIEFIDEAWGVYDAFDNRIWLYFATDTEAIDAVEELVRASERGYDEQGENLLDRVYARLLPVARASLAAVA